MLISAPFFELCARWLLPKRMFPSPAAARALLLIAGFIAASPAHSVSATYDYDEHGRLERITLSDGTIIEYSYDASGNRTTAAVALGEDTTPPNAPTLLVAHAVSTTRIDLTWAAQSDNIGVTGYRLERCTNAGCASFAQIGTLTATSYSDIGRTPSTTYVYRVAARDAAGNWSDYSAVGSATTHDEPPDTTPPGAPGTPAFSNINMTSATASWAAATDNVGVSGYEYRLNQGSWQTLGNLLSVGLTGLAPATGYTLEVRAQGAAGNVGASSSGTFATPDAAAPTAPANLATSAMTSFAVHLTWSASTDNVGVTGYRVYRNSTHIATVSAPGYTDSSVSGRVAYSYYVVAYDAAGNLSQPSNVLSVTTPDTVAPTAPTSLQASAPAATHVNLSWGASSDQGGSGLAGYRIYRNGGQIATTSATTYTDAGTSGNTAYSYSIVAYDDEGNTSGPSNTVAVTTPPLVPQTPVLAMSWLNSSTFQVSWTTPSGPLSHYHLEVNGQITTRHPPTTSVIFGGVDQDWAIRLRACTVDNHCSNWSNMILATTCADLCN